MAITVDKVRGVFPSDAALQDAIARLTHAGFDRADLGLPDTSLPPREATPDQESAAPTTETDMRQARTLGTGTASAAAALTAAGVVTATGGAAAPAAVAAAAAGLGTAGAMEAAGTAAGRAQHQDRERAAARGELLLSVRVTDDAQQETAKRLMREAGGTRVEALTPPPAIDSSAWTG
jgi:hypothetical protein